MYQAGSDGGGAEALKGRFGGRLGITEFGIGAAGGTKEGSS